MYTSAHNWNPRDLSDTQSISGILLYPNNNCVLGLCQYAIADIPTKNETRQGEGKGRASSE